MASEGGAKKLKELRVVDLRRELENRELDKTGVKAVLTERLQQALQDEGKDPNEYVFEAGTESPKRATPVAAAMKKLTPRTSAKDQSKENGEDEEMLDDSLLEEDMEDEVGNIDEADLELLEMQVLDEEITNTDKNTNELDVEKKTEEKMEEDVPAVIEAPVTKPPVVTETDATKKAPEQSAPATEEAPKVTDKDAPVTKPPVKEIPVQKPVKESAPEASKPASVTAPTATPDPAITTQKEQKEQTTAVIKDQQDAPPDPSSIVPIAPLTVEDIIKMDTSIAQQSAENESLDVHVDDTQNDLDADLLGSEKSDQDKKEKAGETVGEKDEKKEEIQEESKPATKEGEEEKAVKQETAIPESVVKETAAVADKDTKVEKKTHEKNEDEDSSKPAASSSTATKSSTAPKDPKKDEKSSSGAGRNLWVSGLSSSTRATDLKGLFSKHGKVVGAKVVTNARSPGSKCYGFVTMSTADEATKCIQHLHRTELHGKMISVERAKNEPGAQVKGTIPTSTTRKPDARSPVDKKNTNTTRKDDRDKRDSDRKSDDKKDDKKDVKRDSRDSKPRSHSSDRRRDPPRRSTGSDRPRTVVMDKSKGEPVVQVSGQDKSKSPSNAKSTASTPSDSKSPASKPAALPAKEGDGAKKDETKDALSFEKIQEERERERLRQRERKLREEERIKKQEIEFEKRRQRDVHMKQRAEAIRLARERERLKKEREMLEREKVETQRLERVRAEQLERERLEREREEKRRLEQLRVAEAEQRRAALKRTYESRGNRDNDWSEPKRANNRFNEFDREKNRDNRTNRDGARFNDRGSSGGNFERKVERYDRREVNRNQDNRGGDNRGTDKRGSDNRGAENRGVDNRGVDNRGVDNRGVDNRGVDNRGVDNRGVDNRGVDNRGGNRQLEDNRRSGGGGRAEDNFRDDQREDRRNEERFERSYDRSGNQAHDVGNRAHDMVSRTHDVGNRAHDVGNRAHDVGTRAHDVSNRAHDVGNRAHDVVSRPHDLGTRAHDMGNRTHDRSNVRDDRRDSFSRDQGRERIRDDRRGDIPQEDNRRGGSTRDNQRDNRSIGAVGTVHNMNDPSPRHTDTRGDWKGERDNRQQGDSRVVVRGQTNMSGGGRDDWQGGHGGGHSGGTYSNIVQDDRARGGNKAFAAHNVVGAGLLGNAPQNQNRQWGSGTDNRTKMEASWGSHNAHGNMDARMAVQQQERWTGGVAMQQEARPTSFTQPVATGIISVPPNVYMTSVPQQSGMIIGGIAPGRQPEPRFDAYKMQPGAIRRTY